MSITTTENGVSVENRTWRITLESPKGCDYSLTYHREKRSSLNGVEIGAPENQPAVTLDAVSIAAETITVDGKTYTAGEIQKVIAAYVDQKVATAEAP
jgi:hypothetical protein